MVMLASLMIFAQVTDCASSHFLYSAALFGWNSALSCSRRLVISGVRSSGFPAALIFATELGFAVVLVAIPQLVIQSALYVGAHQLMPLTTPAMLADFSACGGIIMLATGLRICGIKIFPIVNMLPALILIMPVSALWARLFG